MVIRFTRQLTKKRTSTGDCYVLSIPREIAEELKLPDGGLVSLRIWAHRNEVLIENYEEDSWHPYQEVFSPAKPGFIDVEIEPKTRGRSRGFAEGRVTDPRQFLRETKALCKFLDATRLASGIRRRRRR